MSIEGDRKTNRKSDPSKLADQAPAAVLVVMLVMDRIRRLISGTASWWRSQRWAWKGPLGG